MTNNKHKGETTGIHEDDAWENPLSNGYNVVFDRASVDSHATLNMHIHRRWVIM